MRRISRTLACVIVLVALPCSVHSADDNHPTGTVGEERKAEKQAEKQTHRQSMSVEHGGASSAILAIRGGTLFRV